MRRADHDPDDASNVFRQFRDDIGKLGAILGGPVYGEGAFDLVEPHHMALTLSTYSIRIKFNAIHFVSSPSLI